MRHGSKSPPSLRVKPTVLRWDGSRFMKTSVWCFIKADSRVIWIFKARRHGGHRHSSLSVVESCEEQRRTKAGRKGPGENCAWGQKDRVDFVQQKTKERKKMWIQRAQLHQSWSKLKVPYYTKFNYLICTATLVHVDILRLSIHSRRLFAN